MSLHIAHVRAPRLRVALSALCAALAVACSSATAAPTLSAAYTSAISGQTAAQILAAAYPKSVSTTIPAANVHVLLGDAAPRVVVVAATRLRLVDESRGRATRLVAGHRYRIVYRKGVFVVDDLDARRPRTTLTGPVLIDSGSAPRGLKLIEPAGHTYRGAVRVGPGLGKAMRVTNVVDLERYLWGALPGRLPTVWGVEAPQALLAGAIAARTQALADAGGIAGTAELTAAAPPYIGRDGEVAATTAAVDATRGTVLLQDGAPFAAALVADGWTSAAGGAPIRIAETAPPRVVPGAKPGLGPAIVAAAMALQGTPYKWAGTTPATGFDCSGLLLYVYANQGVTLPRVAQDQAMAGVPVARSQLAPGDAVFFADPDGSVTHVGLYVGDGNFVHSPRTGDVVKVSSLTNTWYAARYAGARRYSY